MGNALPVKFVKNTSVCQAAAEMKIALKISCVSTLVANKPVFTLQKPLILFQGLIFPKNTLTKKALLIIITANRKMPKFGIPIL